MRISVIAVASVVLFAAPVAVALGHNLAVTSNLSPYLYLTRNDMLRAASFPAYHKLVRPELDRRMQHSSSWSVQPPLPELSPYLHLGRKDVTPGFPIYQRMVLPRLDVVAPRALSAKRPFSARVPVRPAPLPIWPQRLPQRMELNWPNSHNRLLHGDSRRWDPGRVHRKPTSFGTWFLDDLLSPTPYSIRSR